MQQRLTGVTDEVFETDLPFYFNGLEFDIRVAKLTENGEETNRYRPLISRNGVPLAHDVLREESPEAAHLAALRWIQATYR